MTAMNTPPPLTPPPPQSTPSRLVAAATSPKVISVAKPRVIVPRIVVYAVEGFGKTTLLTQAESPLILQSRGETGYQSLLDSGLAPALPSDVVETWPDLIGWLDSLHRNPQGIKTLGLDAIGGFERLCHEHVAARDFEGDMGEHGFLSYMRGYDIAVTDWLIMLQKLDKLHAAGMTILLLGHARIKPFQNPLGPNYDRYECDVHAKTWGVTSKWADAVLFGNFFTSNTSKDVKQKGKGIGGADRVIYTERRAAYDAKNRYNMPAEFSLPKQRELAWQTIRGLIRTQGA